MSITFPWPDGLQKKLRFLNWPSLIRNRSLKSDV